MDYSMRSVKGYKELEPYAGSAVAFLREADKNSKSCSDLYAFEDCPEVHFGIIDENPTSKNMFDDIEDCNEYDLGYRISYFIRPQSSLFSDHLSTKDIKGNPLTIRKATLKEIQGLKKAVQLKKADHQHEHCYDMWRYREDNKTYVMWSDLEAKADPEPVEEPFEKLKKMKIVNIPSSKVLLLQDVVDLNQKLNRG